MIVIGEGEEESDPKGNQPGDPDQGDPGKVTAPGDGPPVQVGPPPVSDAAGPPICPGAKAARERALRRLRSEGPNRRHAAALRKAKRRLAHCVARHTG
ncbi:MAG TPA: hypothetical protein VNO20_07650 [Solirubrobacterales bacterium]|nr:hypothetical protein [Solirubrobacterales bacterium]